MPATTTPAAEKHEYSKETFTIFPLGTFVSEASSLRFPPGCYPNTFSIDGEVFTLSHFDREGTAIYASEKNKALIFND